LKRRGKKYQAAVKKVDRTKLYPISEAVSLVKQVSVSKFDGTVSVAMNLGLDPRQADQNIRGAVAMPNGLGKSIRIVVFAKGQKAVEANGLGVEFVGADDLAEKIAGGWLDFDQVVATPDMMGTVGKLGKILGPRGLMPNPKIGTVTFDLATAVKELKAGRSEYRVDKAGIVHAPFGRVSMAAEKLEENLKTLVDAVLKAKPQTAKGTYLQKMSLAPTMGPGVKVDLTPFRA